MRVFECLEMEDVTMFPLEDETKVGKRQQAEQRETLLSFRIDMLSV